MGDTMRVLFAGGGTAGHVTPALAMIKRLQETVPGVEVLYVGTARGKEADIVPREGIPFTTIRVRGFARKLSADTLKAAGDLLVGLTQSLAIVRRFHPDVVVGTGGFVAGPVVFQAALLQVPTLIHEQNALPSVTNRILSRYVSRIAVTFPASQSYFPRKKVTVTGNPVRKAILTTTREEGRTKLGLALDKPFVLVTGGSGGAKRLNEAVLEALPWLDLKGGTLLFITGEKYFPAMKESLAAVDHPNRERVQLVPYLYEMPEALAGADLIVCRAGASTLAEITALGLPAVIIPSPNTAENHQEKNGLSLAKAGAAKVILEKELSGKKLAAAVNELLNNDGLRAEIAERARSLGMPDADEKLVSIILELAKSRKKCQRK